jgi:hypothetical protein
MSWHYYAKPKAPEAPPANIEYLTRLARPRTVHKTFAQFATDQNETAAQARSRAFAQKDKERPKGEEETLQRLVKLPKRYEGGAGKFAPPSLPTYSARDMAPPPNAAYYDKLAQPATVRAKAVIPTHYPPARQPLDAHMFPTSMPDRVPSPSRLRALEAKQELIAQEERRRGATADAHAGLKGTGAAIVDGRPIWCP